MSPLVPQLATTKVLSLLRTMYHVPVDGRKTPISVTKSPSKSSGVGMSPAAPHCAIPAELLELRIEYQVPFDGLNTVTSVFKSPSRSADARARTILSIWPFE